MWVAGNRICGVGVGTCTALRAGAGQVRVELAAGWGVCGLTPGKYFKIELKLIVAQHENLATKGIFGVRVPLRFFFSFRLNKNNPRDFFTDQELDKFRRL